MIVFRFIQHVSQIDQKFRWYLILFKQKSDNPLELLSKIRRILKRSGSVASCKFQQCGVNTFSIELNGYTHLKAFYLKKNPSSPAREFEDLLFFNSNTQPAFKLSGDIIIFGNAEFNQGRKP